MRKSLIMIFLLAGTLSMSAQDVNVGNNGQQSEQRQQRGQRREQMTPEKSAQRVVDEMKKVVSLSDEQYKQIYDACLKQKKEEEALRKNNMSGFGGRGGMNGGFGGEQMGGGFEGGNAGSFSREDMMKQMQVQQKANQKKLDKKFKKIMGDEAFAQWEKYRNEQQAKREEEMNKRKAERKERAGEAQ